MLDIDRNAEFQAEGKKRSRRLIGFTLTASLALNMFGMGWFVTRTIVKDGDSDLRTGILSSQTPLNEAVLMEQLIVQRLTANLSPGGADIFMDVYAKHMASLSGMNSFAEKFNAEIGMKLRSENVTEQELREAFKPLPIAIQKRVSVMTEILAEAIPRLSHEDRMSLPPVRPFTND